MTVNVWHLKAIVESFEDSKENQATKDVEELDYVKLYCKEEQLSTSIEGKVAIILGR